MDPFEYLLMFASVILALAIGDLTISLNRLLQAARTVTWDWLTPLAATVVFLKIVTQWWSWFGAERAASGVTFGMYIGVLAGAVLLFLLAATVLPDQIDDTGVNLRAHYESVHRRFWLLFAAHWIAATGVAIWIEMTVEGAKFVYLSPAYLIVPISVMLAFWWNRWVHLVCLLGFLVLYLGHAFGHTLTS